MEVLTACTGVLTACMEVLTARTCLCDPCRGSVARRAGQQLVARGALLRQPSLLHRRGPLRLRRRRPHHPLISPGTAAAGLDRSPGPAWRCGGAWGLSNEAGRRQITYGAGAGGQPGAQRPRRGAWAFGLSLRMKALPLRGQLPACSLLPRPLRSSQLHQIKQPRRLPWPPWSR